MKKLIAMLLVLTMVLSFAACAKQDTVTPTVADVAITTAAADPTPAAETEASDPAPVVTAMNHADYVAADNETEVVVETYVQAHQSWWDNKVTVYCQSPDGAYFLYELACSEEDAALLGTDELIDHQNEFVSFTGLTVAPSTDANGNEAAFLYNWDGSGEKGNDLYFNVTVNGQTYNFCVESYLCGQDTEVYQAVEALQIGDVINAEGFLYWYEGVNPHITSVSAAN